MYLQQSRCRFGDLVVDWWAVSTLCRFMAALVGVVEAMGVAGLAEWGVMR